MRAASAARVATLTERLPLTTSSVALGVVCLLGVGLRLLYLDAKPLWLDEALSVFFARQPLPDLIRLVLSVDSQHPPTYYLLLHLWLRLFGDGEVSVRFPSVLASSICIPLYYALIRTLADHRVAIFSTVMLAISPFHIIYAQEARSYSLFALGSLASSFLFLRLMREGRLTNWLAYSASMTITIWIHYFGAFELAAHGLVALIVGLWWRPSGSFRLWTWSGIAVSGLSLLPPLWILAQQSPGRGFWIPPSSPGLLMFVLTRFVTGEWVVPGAPLLATYVAIGAIMLVVCAGALALRDRRETCLFMTVWFVLPISLGFLIGLIRPILWAKYLIYSTFPLYFLLAVGLIWLIRRWRVLGLLATLGIAALMIASVLDFYLVNTKQPWRDVTRHVAERSEAGDVVLFTPAHIRLPFEYSYRQSGPTLQLGSGFPGDNEAIARQQDQELARLQRDRRRPLWLVVWRNPRVLSDDDLSFLRRLVDDGTVREEAGFADIQVVRLEP